MQLQCATPLQLCFIWFYYNLFVHFSHVLCGKNSKQVVECNWPVPSIRAYKYAHLHIHRAIHTNYMQQTFELQLNGKNASCTKNCCISIMVNGKKVAATTITTAIAIAIVSSGRQVLMQHSGHWHTNKSKCGCVCHLWMHPALRSSVYSTHIQRTSQLTHQCIAALHMHMTGSRLFAHAQLPHAFLHIN